MKKVLLPLIIILGVTLNSFAYNIENAKVGSTVITTFNIIGKDIEGHAAIIINEYTNAETAKFIVGFEIIEPLTSVPSSVL